MARIYGLNGALRGKQGNNVFSIQNGTQVVKAYQPVVSNPRTFQQMMQRSKFALAGKISSVVPSGALVGLGEGNKRSRRADFVSLIARAATTTSTPSGQGVQVSATVAYRDITFSRGSVPRCSIITRPTAAYQGSEGDYRLHVTMNGFGTDTISSIAPTGYGELVVVCMFDPSTSRLDGCQYAVRTVEGMTFDFAVVERPACHVAIYTIPFAPLDGVSGFAADGNLSDTASAVALAMQSETFLSGMRFGDSRLAWTIAVNAPASMVAPAPEDDARKKK